MLGAPLPQPANSATRDVGGLPPDRAPPNSKDFVDMFQAWTERVSRRKGMPLNWLRVVRRDAPP